MKRTIFITGTDTGAGKTVLATLLVSSLRRDGLKAAAFKPVCSGGRDDARKLFTAIDGVLSLDEVNPWHFRAPIAPALAARRERRRVTLPQVVRHLRRFGDAFESVLVEGAGGLLSPLGEGFDSRDLIRKLRAAPIIVAPNKLGVVNQLRLTLEALPKDLRRKSRIVLMSPATSDASTPLNAGLLGEFFDRRRIFLLPWLGRKPDIERALKNPATRKTLRALVH